MISYLRLNLNNYALWVWNTISLRKNIKKSRSNWFSLDFYFCEPSGFRVEHLLESILKTYERLKELGFTYYNGKIVVIDVEEVKHD